MTEQLVGIADHADAARLLRLSPGAFVCPRRRHLLSAEIGRVAAGAAAGAAALADLKNPIQIRVRPVFIGSKKMKQDHKKVAA